MIQEEFFKKTQTDNLLRLTFCNYIVYPKMLGDKPNYVEKGGGECAWSIDKKLLYEELAKRPHRVRARDRRKIKIKN
jgi:hypothetical protein